MRGGNWTEGQDSDLGTEAVKTPLKSDRERAIAR